MTDSSEVLAGLFDPLAVRHPVSSGGRPPMTKTGAIPSRESNGRSHGPKGGRESEILDCIRHLTAEKDSLRRGHEGRPMSSAHATRLKQVDSALDKSWDLVRQRRARRAAGQAWDDLSPRVAELVEGRY